MSTPSVYSLTDYDFGGLNYTTPKKVNGHYYVCAQHTPVGSELSSKFYFQTPRMALKSGLSNEEGVRLFIDTICDNASFVSAIQRLDEHVFNTIKDKREEWFPNKNIDDTFLEVGQTHSIMKNNVVRLKVDKNVQIYNHEKTLIYPTDVSEQAYIKCIVQFTGIWFTATRWGLTLNIVQLHVYPEKRRAESRSHHGYMFPDEDSDDSADGDEESHMPIPPPGV